MTNVRVIKRKDGTIQVQHRPDGVYTDALLPEGTQPADVEATALVDASELADVTDTQTQLDIVEGTLVKNLTAKSATVRLAEQRAAAEAILAGLEADASVPSQIKSYLVALRDLVGVRIVGND